MNCLPTRHIYQPYVDRGHTFFSAVVVIGTLQFNSLHAGKFFIIFCHLLILFYPPTKSEEYSLSVVPPFRPSVHTFCLSGTISQYLLVRFDSFLVQMISTMDPRYPISLVKIDPLTLVQINFFNKLFQIKQFGSRSGLKLCRPDLDPNYSADYTGSRDYFRARY